jgi:hypothetical protein
MQPITNQKEKRRRNMKTETTIAIALLAVVSALLSGCAGAMQDLHDGQGPRGILGVPLAVSMPIGGAIAQAGANLQAEQDRQALIQAQQDANRASIIRSMQPQRVDVYIH